MIVDGFETGGIGGGGWSGCSELLLVVVLPPSTEASVGAMGVRR